MQIINTKIDEVKIIIPKYFEDERGYYAESYSYRNLENELNLEFEIKQEGHSFSKNKGTIRGIHFQNAPHAQAKIVRCIKGSVMDYAVDLRKDSLTYKKWIGVELSSENRKQLYIPKGFGHLFVTLEDDSEIIYKVDEFYSAKSDRSISYLDGEIGLNIMEETPTLSSKDMNAPTLKESDCNL